MESQAKRMKLEVGRSEIRITEEDITSLRVDAIVNPANEQLVLGAGVAGAIAAVGGPTIQAECDRIVGESGPCPTGEARLTAGGKLRAKHVIHAVGPRAEMPEADALLARAVRSALELAAKQHYRTVALPAISTGVFGFPMDRCAEITVREIHGFLSNQPKLAMSVLVALIDPGAFALFTAALTRYARPVGSSAAA